MSSGFFFPALLMLLLALAFILLPLSGQRWTRLRSRRQWNLRLFEERLRELEQEYQRGNYAETDYNQLRTELQRRMLDEAGSADPAAGSASPSAVDRATRVLALMLALLLIAGSVFVYRTVGALPDWEIAGTLRQLDQQGLPEAERERVLAVLQQQLADRLQSRPDNTDYRMLAGRLLMQAEDFAAAAAEFEQLLAIAPESPEAIAQYVQASFLAAGRVLTPSLRSQAEQGLALAPNQTTLLGLLGMATFEQADYAAALDYWQRLLPLLPPQSREARMISAGISEARRMLGDEAPPAASASAQIALRVTLDPSLKADPADRVFIFARAPDGPPMPLAVAVLTVADLPAEVVLSDAQAMTPELKLSDFAEVMLVARVARGGGATAQSGDLEGRAGPVSPGAETGLIALQIDAVVP